MELRQCVETARCNTMADVVIHCGLMTQNEQDLVYGKMLRGFREASIPSKRAGPRC
jgi:hypothetical protein